ncbi:MAG: hypothetical protein JOY64_06660 [Alphaproteobacteria bacterium]|nr:hypothetical protein [Alphaproteobacteria bacterium]MBV8407292.1 hypothetical protein [Alphaproteobacteria bacterium]
MRHVGACTSLALGLAACSASSSPPPLPPVWSATYDVAFDAMVSCLSAKPAAAYAVSRPEYFQEGVMRIGFTPAKTPQADSAYTLRRTANGTTVIWRRPGNVGDMDWLDNEARSRADRCAATA